MTHTDLRSEPRSERAMQCRHGNGYICLPTRPFKGRKKNRQLSFAFPILHVILYQQRFIPLILYGRTIVMLQEMVFGDCKGLKIKLILSCVVRYRIPEWPNLKDKNDGYQHSLVHTTDNPPYIYTSLIARFMGPTWDPSGADRTHVGPMLAP